MSVKQQHLRPGLEAQGYLGCRDRPFVNALAAAGRRALANHSRRCEAITKAPPHGQCRCVPVRGMRFCTAHLPLVDFVRADAERRERFEAIAATSTWAAERAEANLRLVAIERRRLRYVWSYIDPNMPGALVSFANENDELRCIDWLKRQGFDPYGYSPVTNEPVSACCRDRCLWAALKLLIKKNISEKQAMIKVRRAHESERRWHAKLKKAEPRAALEASE
jgi:hypothetical protein